jgi:hypothetical protein
VYGTVRTVVWEDGGGDPASYPIFPQDWLFELTEFFDLVNRDMLASNMGG